jgi:hypothetical protein
MCFWQLLLRVHLFLPVCKVHLLSFNPTRFPSLFVGLENKRSAKSLENVAHGVGLQLGNYETASGISSMRFFACFFISRPRSIVLAEPFVVAVAPFVKNL